MIKNNWGYIFRKCENNWIKNKKYFGRRQHDIYFIRHAHTQVS